MDNKKKMEELEASFKQNNILITQYQAEIQKLVAIQEQIKGKFELLAEMEKVEEPKIILPKKK